MKITLTPEQKQMAIIIASKKSRGGVSRVRPEKAERIKYVYRDNLVGCVGEIALTVYMFGSTFMYRLAQLILSAHENYDLGDGGYDIPGLNVDIKSTYYTAGSRDRLQYHLIVNNKEYKPDWNYYFCIVDGNEKSFGDVYLAGWMDGEELREKDIKRFRGAYSVEVAMLNKLPKYRWDL